jgi:acetylornithine/N-succinyldiaminopimelate aminotransferase
MGHTFDTSTAVGHCPFMPVFGPPALMLERGDGTEVFATDGTRYLDFLAGIAVVSLGHSNPVIADAIAEQARKLVHVSNFFANPVATAAAMSVDGLLTEATGRPGQVFFTNSGAEANECALKLARKFAGPGRHNVVTALGSFHGRTLATLAATGQPAKHEPFAPMPEGFIHVPWGDLAAIEAAVDDSVGAVFLESVQGEGGVNPAPAGYLEGVREICTRKGALMMIDEVQTGFARTGAWFGFEHSGVSPDVVTLAKAMGNGMPIGACWAPVEIAAAFVPGDHGSTYSGTALATVAVETVISEMKRLDAPVLARTAEARIRTLLDGADGVAGVRGSGLLLGVALEEGIVAGDVAAEALANGLIVNAVNAATIRLAPPLTVSDKEIEEAIAILIDAISVVRSRS